ncbi:hypothetical protein HDU91_006186, partial [Kappamyces sp. JEL0680]
MMNIVKKAKAKKTFPTGNPNFSVMQAFPAGIPEKETDPFLMCDYFGTTPSAGQVTDPDTFPVNWHPHRGMDICTYLRSGVGRHADSMGNRGTFATPGMQWISVGSGIEHAEGGGTPKGEPEEGFQLWFNTPAVHKMDDPQYGTEPPASLPLLTFDGGVTGRLLAGPASNQQGPFRTATPVQVVDFELPANTAVTQQIPAGLDNCILFVYQGRGTVCDEAVDENTVLRLDATNPAVRGYTLATGAQPMKVMVFAGKMLKEPIV